MGCQTLQATPGELETVFQWTMPVSSLLFWPMMTFPRCSFLPNILCLPITEQVKSQAMKTSLVTLKLLSPSSWMRYWLWSRRVVIDIFLRPIRVVDFFTYDFIRSARNKIVLNQIFQRNHVQ